MPFGRAGRGTSPPDADTENVYFSGAGSETAKAAPVVAGRRSLIETLRDSYKARDTPKESLDSVIQSLDLQHIDTDPNNADRGTSFVPPGWGGLTRGNVVRRGNTMPGTFDRGLGARGLSMRTLSNRHYVQSGYSTPSDVESSVTSDEDINPGILCNKNALGSIFRNRGKTVQRAKERMRRQSRHDLHDGRDYSTTPQSKVTNSPHSKSGRKRTESSADLLLSEESSPGTTVKDDGVRHNKTSPNDNISAESAVSSGSPRLNVDAIFSKIKRAVSHDLSDEIRPPLVHSFTNKIFAIRTPWQLPMKESSLRNNVQQLLSFFRLLERYVEDQVYKFGPAIHPRLDRVYNDLYAKVGHMFKRLPNSQLSQLDELRRIGVVGNDVYDLGDHRPRGAPVYYQKFVIFDLSLDSSSISQEHGDLFHRQVLHFPMNFRGLPSMQYLCAVSSAVLFWLDFYNRDNVVIFNYNSLNYNILLTFACSVVASQPLATANEVDQLIMGSFDWRRNCRVFGSKSSRDRPDPTKPNDMPQMIPIARWPPSYKRYMSYFLSMYVTPIDFVLAQQFRIKRITLVNCFLPGTEVMLEIYQVGPDISQVASTRRWASTERRAQCSRYSAAFFPKCVCGGKDRDGVMLVACSSDYQLLNRSISSKPGRMGYVGEVIFDFKLDASGNRQDVVVSGDVAVVMIGVSMKQRKVIASYSFNTGFINSESLEIPKAEFDIWDTSLAIQPQGQMTIAMESRQRHNTDAWNTATTPIVITPPMSDVGVFMRHHIAKVYPSDIDKLVKATGLSSDTCEFALKLCPRYMDAMAILNALFVPKNAKVEDMVTAGSGAVIQQGDLYAVDSVDTLNGYPGSQPSIGTLSIGTGKQSGDTSDRTDIGATFTSSGDVHTGLTVEQVERLLVDREGAMQLLLTDGTTMPVPHNSITSLFQMFGNYQGHVSGSLLVDSPGERIHHGAAVGSGPFPIGGAAIPSPYMGPGFQPGTASPTGVSIPGEATGTVSKDGGVTRDIHKDASKPKDPSTESGPAAPSKPKESDAATAAPKSDDTSTTPADKPREPSSSSTVTKPSPEAPVPVVKKPAPPPSPSSKAAPPATKKAPPLKMKAPPPPAGLKGKGAFTRKPLPLGIKLHWKTLNDNTVKGTIFENLPRNSVEDRVFDFVLAKKLFSKAAVKRQQALKAPDVKRKLMQTILDAKRAQNVGIILRFPKESDFDELIDALDNLALDNELINVENLFKIQTALPQGTELELFNAALASGANIATYRDIEQKIFKIIAKKDMENKVRVAFFSINYKALLNMLDSQLSVFERANDQIFNNPLLPTMMGGILQYGNFVNHGDDCTVKTVGFSLSSATKLIDIKSADNTMSSMHYLMVNLTVKFPNLDFMSIDKTLSHVLDAEKISATGIDEIFDEIRDGLNSLLRMVDKLDTESTLYTKTKDVIAASTELIGAATERKIKVFEMTRNTWRYLGEECRQGNSLEEIFQILADFMRCIKRTMTEIQQKPSKYIVALNADDEREAFNQRFSRTRR
ncbi:formin homology 2 domain containing protein [Babesia bovis T2Bo]|uniref:formin homology 2 domain containing protein n=1 Tax=Babesia bovis T2Bo TaxID=484906 RepID=UPI001D3CD476|nr:formin homology 2 domain containing protein [Babesia bovis T2Bo]KAG6439942.1 formin homology 2 domain containing protein [Babesia bovis T2Bo]